MRYLSSSYRYDTMVLFTIVRWRQSILLLMMMMIMLPWQSNNNNIDGIFVHGFSISSLATSRKRILPVETIKTKSKSALFSTGKKNFSAREIRSSESFYQEEQEQQQQSGNGNFQDDDGLVRDQPGDSFGFDNSQKPVDRTPYQPPGGSTSTSSTSSSAFANMFPSSPSEPTMMTPNNSNNNNDNNNNNMKDPFFRSTPPPPPTFNNNNNNNNPFGETPTMPSSPTTYNNNNNPFGQGAARGTPSLSSREVQSSESMNRGFVDFTTTTTTGPFTPGADSRPDDGLYDGRSSNTPVAGVGGPSSTDSSELPTAMTNRIANTRGGGSGGGAGGGGPSSSEQLPAMFRQMLSSSSTTSSPLASSGVGEPKIARNKAVTNENVNNDDAVPGGNTAYVESLIRNLQEKLDKYKLTQRPNFAEEAYRALELIQLYTLDVDLIAKAKSMVEKAGLTVPTATTSTTNEKKPSTLPPTVIKRPIDPSGKTPFGSTNDDLKMTARKGWKQWNELQKAASLTNPAAAPATTTTTPVTDVLVPNSSNAPFVPNSSNSNYNDLQNKNSKVDKSMVEATTMVSEFIAKSGGISNFEGKTLGIGGLDDVLNQIKRRVWIPLAAPPILLQELNIQPVRGLLLYGQSGNGKSLLARTIGKLLSPLRPVTIVSGPEIMDKFVGSSEKKLREIFDNPPDIYDHYKAMEYGESIRKAALHVIIMDEFDAISRSRGGKGGGGDQGDAGVARDSVVNQLLAKMDGVEPLVVPTLVIGLTNRRSLIDGALLRPGRFEVQIEVPPPRTVEQRVSILDVHLRHMHAKGRLLVRDAPLGSAAFQNADDKHPTYRQFLINLANKCNGFSGASLASVARAAACHALERSVQQFAHSATQKELTVLMNCIVRPDDFDAAIKEILEGNGTSDWGDEESNKS